MGIAKIYNQKQSGFNINGIIEDYYVYAGEKVSAGDFVEFINGVAGQKIGTSVDTAINNTDSRSSEVISAVELPENRVFVAHNKDTSDYYLYGVVCTIEHGKIIVGTDTQLSTERYTGYQISTVLLDDGRVFIAHSYSTSYNLYGMLCTIEGSSITVNKDTNLASSYAGAGKRLSATKLTGSKVFVAHIVNDTNYFLYATVISISGNTITMGTMKSLAKYSTKYSGYMIATTTLSSTNVFVAHSFDSNYYLHGVSVTISGTTISFVESSDIALTSAVANSGRFIAVKALDSTKVLVTHCSDNSALYLHGIVCTVSGTSTTKGTDTQLSTSQYTGSRVSTPILLDNGKVLIAHGGASSTGSAYSLYSMTCNISGTTILVESDVRLNDEIYSGITRFPILLSSGELFIAHSLTSANTYLYAQLFSIDEANNVPTDNVLMAEYETQVKKVSTTAIYGVAKTSGEGGDNTGHKDIVSVYTIGIEEPDEPVVPDEPTYTYTDFTSNPAPTTWTDSSDYLSATASNSYGEWKVEATKVASSTNKASCAFDGSTDNYWRPEDLSTDTTYVSCTIYLPTGVSIKPTIFAVSYGQFKSASIRGLNETTGNWDTIVSLTETSSNKYSPKPTTTTTDYYTAFRVYGRRYSSGYDQPRVHDFEITSGTLKIRD